MRIFYVLLFCVIFSVMELLVAAIAILQCLISLFNDGKANTDLQDFGARLGIYLKQIAEFVSFASDEKPFPFSDWPERHDRAE